VTAAQVIFNFSIQIGMLPLTGTTNVKHMREDLQSVNLQLTPEEISMIEAA
jgi:diketogulonate reductase-like aldo/keto reductase